MAEEKDELIDVCITNIHPQSHAPADYEYQYAYADADDVDMNFGFQFPSHHHFLGDDTKIVVVGDTLGLKSTITQDFLRRIQDNLQAAAAAAGAGSDQHEHQHEDDEDSNNRGDNNKEECRLIHNQGGKGKVVNKAESFIANSFIIGSWQWDSKNKGDLIGKCYYAKKKLVWEIINGTLKRKIEFNWSNILGITSFINQQNLGVFQVELKEPPKFYIESEPRPRKHTTWIPTNADFTGMQATVCRRHNVVVLPSYLAELNKLYEKLLECDPNLLMLSQMPFPTQYSPYFNDELLDFEVYSNQTHIPDIYPTEDHAQISSFTMPVSNNHRMTANSPAMNWDEGTYYGFGCQKDDSGFNSNDELPQNDDQLEIISHSSDIMMMPSSSFLENCNSTISLENTSAIVPHVDYPATNYALPIDSTGNNIEIKHTTTTEMNEDEQNKQKSAYEKHQHPLIQDQDNPIHR